MTTTQSKVMELIEAAKEMRSNLSLTSLVRNPHAKKVRARFDAAMASVECSVSNDLGLAYMQGSVPTRQFLLELLKGLEAAVPPPPNCHHTITFARYGSDADGWEDKLALQVNIEGKFQAFFLEEDDMAGTPETLIASIASLLKITSDNIQFGVAMGQYIR